MNTATIGLLIETPTLGLGGFLLGRFMYGTSRGNAMRAHIKNSTDHGLDRVGRWLDWIGEGRRLPATIVAVIFLTLGGLGYTVQSRAVSAGEVSRLVDCITFYSHYTSDAQKDRGTASTASQHSLGVWIADPTAANRQQYLDDLSTYLDTASAKPFRLFDRQFCMDYQANRIDK